MTNAEKFKGWFAVETSQDTFWPGRLKYNPKTEITLEVVNFSNFEPEGFLTAKHSNDALFEGDVIKGYLDYQRPTTLLKPFISKVSPGKIGQMTPIMRSRYRITLNGILKNIHLDKLNNEVFLSIGGTSDALRAWISPTLAKRDSRLDNGVKTVEYEEYGKSEIELADGLTLVIVNMVSGPSSWNSLSLNGRTSYMIKFKEPIALYRALEVRHKFLNFITFLVGDRYSEGPISLATTKTSNWNGEERPIHAELLVRSNLNHYDSLEHPLLMFLNQHETKMTLEDVLVKWQKIDKDTQYFMGLITSVEMRDKDTNLVSRFTDIVGCLEKFDKNKSGGKRTLLQRLERLLESYSEDGFRGAPDLQEIKTYRNYQPHGDGASLTSDIVKKMYWYSNFLCALGRYHILKELGFSADEISEAFIRKANVYGAFSIQSSSSTP